MRAEKVQALQRLVREALGTLPLQLREAERSRIVLTDKRTARNGVIARWCSENPDAVRVVVGAIASLYKDVDHG